MAHTPSLAASPDATAAEVSRLASTALQASAAVFYWVDNGHKMADVSLAGVSTQFYFDYATRMEEADPSNIRRMSAARHCVTHLRQPNHPQPVESAIYSRLLRDYGVTDVVDLMFWSAGEAVAGLALLKRQDDPVVTADSIHIAGAMQRYVEFTLQKHERLHQSRRRRAMQQTYRLTMREIAVAELVFEGLTNAEIAESLHMKLPTVKSHLLQIFGKTGCGNRTKLTAVFSRMSQVDSLASPPGSNVLKARCSQHFKKLLKT